MKTPIELKILCLLDTLLSKAQDEGKLPSWLKGKSCDNDNKSGEIILTVENGDATRDIVVSSTVLETTDHDGNERRNDGGDKLPFGGSHAPDCPYRLGGECQCWRSDPEQNPELKEELDG